MKITRPKAPNQFIHFNGFALPSTGDTSVVFGMDAYTNKLFEPVIFSEGYTFEDFVKYIQQVLDRPEIRKDWKSVTVVTDIEQQYIKALKQAVSRPVKFVGNYVLNEKAVKETREGIRNSWLEYSSSMLFSLAS
jgi:hypothetical protein